MATRLELTVELRDKIVAKIRNGNYPSVAAQSCNVGRTTYFKWMTFGREGQQPYADFADAVKEAHADAETELLNIIKIAASESWQAAAWLLERTRGSRYSRRMAPEDREAQNGAVDALAAAIKAHRDRKAAG